MSRRPIQTPSLGLTDFEYSSASASASSTGPSLKVSLAQATARVDELQVENQVLQAAVKRSSEVVAEKEKLGRQREELERHLKLLRDEMAVLETDLRTERSRLRNLTSEHTLAGKARAALEARLATAEAVRPRFGSDFLRRLTDGCGWQELRDVKRELASAGSPAELDRLRAEKSQLQEERADLLRQLAEVKAVSLLRRALLYHQPGRLTGTLSSSSIPRKWFPTCPHLVPTTRHSVNSSNGT